MLHCYGVVRSEAGDRGALDLPEGVEGAPVEPVSDEDLAALVSTVERRPRGSHANLTAHLRVLEETLDRTPVVPSAFGQVFETRDDVVATLLRAHRRRLRELLRQVAGRVEMRLQGRYDQERVIRWVVRNDPAAHRRLAAATVDDRVALGRRIAEGVGARQRRDLDLVVDTVRPLVEDWHAEEPSDAMTAFAVSVLVDRDRVDDLSEAAEELAGALGDEVEVALVGPMPPLSFVSLEG